MESGEAVRLLRSDSARAQLVTDAYLDEDAKAAAERFLRSGEFAEVINLLGDRSKGKILDLGAGRGIASYAFAKSGSERVFSLEPSESDVVGTGVMRQILGHAPVDIFRAWGEALPLKTGSLDTIYTRAVLHHAQQLGAILMECARVLQPGGYLLATREHVVDNQDQLEEFLKNHPLHHLTHDENAFARDKYISAIEGAGLRLLRVMRPWDSVLNAYPLVKSQGEISEIATRILQNKFGEKGTWMASLPMVQALVRFRLNRPTPGRLYSFLAMKPT